jgi:hypothetical protein
MGARAAVIALLAAGTLAFPALATPPAQRPECAALYAGTAGTPEDGSARGLPDSGNDSPATGPVAPAGLGLPDRVAFRTTTESFNRRYWFALRGGRIWFRSNADVTGRVQPWREVPIPACLGTPAAISADDDELIALDGERNVFTMDHALDDPAQFNWTYRWGPVVWTGNGRALPADALAWSWSVVSPLEDVNWTDAAGNRHAIGQGKVSHVFLLRRGGQRIEFTDPWLPLDDSYEVCGPIRGRLKAVSLSASGSTIMVIDRHGDVYTRVWDFDLSGSDAVFFSYSYEDQRGRGSDAPLQLPAAPWVRQPLVPGRVTDRISLHKVGRDTVHRVMRVEGTDRSGRTGYWERDIALPAKAGWAFHAASTLLAGHPLGRPRHARTKDLGGSEDRRYVLRGDGFTAELTGFNPYCSPSLLSVKVAGFAPIDLALHTADGLRQTPRARGLDAESREQYGTIAVPLKELARRPAPVREFIAQHIGTNRFNPVTVQATKSGVLLQQPGWTLRDAGPRAH